MIDLVWMDGMGARHLFVVKVNARTQEPVCGWAGTPAAPGMPCEECRETLWAAVANTLPIHQEVPQEAREGVSAP